MKHKAFKQAGDVVQLKPRKKSASDELVRKLKGLMVQALRVRQAMDFCFDHLSDERLLAECETDVSLIMGTILVYAKRHQCSVVDAREYVSRALAERQQGGVASTSTPPANKGQPTEDSKS
jgi:hypothetical protein